MNDKQTGRTYWKSLHELADTPALREAIDKEFPGYDPNQMVSQSRRGFLKLAGASMALAGITLTGCRRWPKENIVEQTSRPQGRIPGVPERYASMMELGGFAQPLLVTTYDGRPIKVEGNPLHPISQTFGGKLGSSTLLAQATLLEMYDPERSRAIIRRTEPGKGEAAAPEALVGFISEHFAKYKDDGSKLAVLIEETRSPTVLEGLKRFTQTYKNAKVYSYEPVSRDNQLVADKASFGAPVRQILDLSKADLVVSFDSDLLGNHPGMLRHTNDWAQKRKTVDAEAAAERTMNRMYVVESMFSMTGAVADERVPSTIARIESLVQHLAARVGSMNAAATTKPAADLSNEDRALIDRMAGDLQSHRGRAVVTGGYHLRPEILAIINQINVTLGAVGTVVTLLPETDRPTHLEQIKALADAINAKQVETLVIIGGNPSYDAPAELNFAGLLPSVPTSMHLSLYDNETSNACKWHVNRAHYLESWGDGVAWDGSVSVQQPMIRPLFNGYTAASFLAALQGETPATVMGLKAEQATELTLDQAVLYRTWQGRMNDPFIANSKPFRQALHDGFVKSNAAPVRPGTAAGGSFAPAPAPVGDGKFEVRFAADYTKYDGRFANNGWLQECPDPITKITWDNCALLSYADAKELGINQNDYETDVIRITVGANKIEIPGYIMPGQPKGVITLPLGYGRTVAGAIMLTDRPGSIGSGIGYDTYRVRTSANAWYASGVKVELAGTRVDVATTQTQHIIEPLGVAVRDERIGVKSQPGMIVHESTLAGFNKDHHAPHAAGHKLIELQLFPEPYAPSDKKREGGPKAFNEPHAWGMAIDMNTCIGCNACVVACQAENNIPIVGKDMVIRGREMHWLRIDRYFKASGDTYEEIIGDENPQITFQPMTCVHCENAPCEQVCPVAATVHDSEGLNTMVYNRCIGTRYCSNNCPYKVRRFNYLDFHSKHPREHFYPWLGIPDTQQEHEVDKIKRLMFNPEVTVRMRGIMEKCTYCVQRIKAATISKKNAWEQAGSQPVTKPDGRPGFTVDDFDMVTACQQACPAEAIVFGDLNDPNSLVTKLQKNQRSYAVLQELNNRPRTHHLAKLRNPAVEPVAKKSDEH
jgi:molybdopterin-containing oxidoreductase family iron-sulfur binding subunit